MNRQPILFISHGAPLLAIDAQRGAPLRELATQLKKLRGILVVSAHWEATPVTIGSTQTLPLIYDFSGFPKALYEMQYPAPGAPELAEAVVSLLGSENIRRNAKYGLDHGTWSPLVHLFPHADVPVLQISLPSQLTPTAIFAVGQRLAPLADEGYLLIGSGNMTHNLGVLQPDGSEPQAFAHEFDDWARDVLMRRDFDTLLAYHDSAPAFSHNHPTEEHWLPLLFSAGAASTTPSTITFPVTGFEFGNLSRRTVLFT